MPARNMNRMFDNVDEGFDAVFDAVRAGNQTTERVYRYAIDEMHRTQREQTELGRRWADAPLDVVGLSRAVVETWQMRARRRAGLVRSMFGEMVSAGREARTAAEVVAGAGRSVTRAGFDAGREAIEDAGDQVRRGAEQAVERVGSMADNGREEVRKAAARTANAVEEITDLTAAREQRNGSLAKSGNSSRKKTNSRTSTATKNRSRSRSTQRRRSAS